MYITKVVGANNGGHQVQREVAVSRKVSVAFSLPSAIFGMRMNGQEE